MIRLLALLLLALPPPALAYSFLTGYEEATSVAAALDRVKAEPQKLVEKGLEKGVIINLTAKKVVRLGPAINITAGEWDRGLDLVAAVIAEV